MFFVFWLMISGHDPADLVVGLVTAAAAAWLSLRLLPRTRTRLRLWSVIGFGIHFLRQSVVSGLQVARLAFQPTMSLRPGFVRYQSRLQTAGERNAFCALASLLPGTLPTGTDETGALLIHCLDVERPVAAEFAAEESRFMRMLGDE